MTDISFERYPGERVSAILDAVVDLYLEIRSERAGEHYEMFSRASFIERTNSQAQKGGFDLIAATSEHALVGFGFGYPMAVGQWWTEKKLLDILISGRPEKYATLAARPDSPAHAMYIRWGWYTVGVYETPPVMDAMVLPLG
jgi:hypothetical protein